jgi:hypothetical protein
MAQELMTVQTPAGQGVGFICGFFFHSLTRGVRVLSVLEEHECFMYMMFSLTPNELLFLTVVRVLLPLLL